MLQGLPPDPSRLSDLVLLRLVVATVKPPRGDLASAAVTIRAGRRVILQYYNTISPVLSVKIVP